jgi:hypothetical protein
MYHPHANGKCEYMLTPQCSHPLTQTAFFTQMSGFQENGHKSKNSV